MMRKVHLAIWIVLLASVNGFCQRIIPGSETSVSSPDGRISARFYQKMLRGYRTMFYSVNYGGKPVIQESKLDIQLDNNLSEKAMALKVDTSKHWCQDLKVTAVRNLVKDTLWKPVFGERSVIRDHFNGRIVELVKEINPIYSLHVQIRAYDQGIAFRFYFPENPKGTYYNITAEKTEFVLPEGTLAWFANWAQAPYVKLPLRDWPGESERPLTMELSDGTFVCLAEAQMTDYARTKFRLSTEKKNTLVTSMAGEAALISPVSTPWRVVMVGKSPGVLVENNDLLLNLNEKSRINNEDWIKPGKIMRVMTQTTAEARANIDFAADRGLQYILFDWKWYGPAFSFDSDATKVAIPDFDLPAIIRYGKEKGVGVWLYVNQQALLAQSDSLFKKYREWGVKGVKFGFVQVGSHRWTTWLEKTIQQSAKERIMVNIHDDWRPTGEQRTWPNLMTAEGIRGNEEMPDATHNTILPFTRYIAGAADYTICYFDQRIKTTHGHQLALAAIYYSPIQTLYWYDKPGQYQSEPELEFWKMIPTTWDETKVLQGMPGQYVVMARRSGQEWFMGSITNNNERDIELKFDFLPTGKSFDATMYSDDPTMATRTHVRVKKIKVNSGTKLPIRLLASGGQAILLTPSK